MLFPKALALKVKQVRGSFPLSAEFKTFFFPKEIPCIRTRKWKVECF